MVSDSPPIEQAVSQRRENQLRFILTVGSRRRWTILGCTLVFMVLLGGWELTRRRAEVRYEAYTDLIVKQSPYEKEILRGVGGTPLVPTTPRALINSMSSTDLAGEVARALVQEDIAEGRPEANVATEEEYKVKAEAIKNAIFFEEVRDANVIRVRAQSGSEKEAPRMAEFAARVFIEQTRRFQMEEEEQFYEFVRNQIAQLQKDLNEAERAEWDFREQTGFMTPGQVTDDLETMNRQLADAETQKAELHERMVQIREELKQKNEELPQALGQMDDAVINELLAEWTRLRTEQAIKSVELTDQAPAMQDLEEEITYVSQAILEIVGESNLSLGGGVSVVQDRQTLREQYLKCQLDLAALMVRTETLKKRLSDRVQQIPELANKQLQQEQLTRAADQLRGEFDKLVAKEFEIKSSLSRGFGQVERQGSVHTKELVTAGREMRLLASCLVGAIVGLIVGFGVAILLETLDTSIRAIEDVSEYLGLEVLGTIPKMRFGTKPRRGRRRRGTYVIALDEDQIDACIVTQHDPKSPISEAYRAFRTNFQFATIQQKPRTVMVTSAVPGEGKTTTAVNMAVTMADQGMRVLIIDTDLRRPNVHRVLKMERGPGLADVLRTGVDFRSVTRPTRIENLWIISSGRVPPNPSELIGSERMQRFMKQAGEAFDLVICDAPSILVVTDPVLLATHVDTVVIVVAVAHARRETILRGKKLIEAANARIAGVVLNGLEASRRHYYYYYYYYADDAARGERRWYHL